MWRICFVDLFCTGICGQIPHTRLPFYRINPEDQGKWEDQSTTGASFVRRMLRRKKRNSLLKCCKELLGSGSKDVFSWLVSESHPYDFGFSFLVFSWFHLRLLFWTFLLMSRLYDGWNLIPAKPAGEVFADVILIARHGVSPKKLHISIREGSMMAMF